MKRLKGQNGNASVVVIIILVVALLGALGVVFYQNFITGSGSSQPPQTAVAPAKSITTTQLAFNNTIYELDYPKSWHKTQTATAQPDGQNEVKLTNPAGSIEVRLTISQGGFGGACDVSDGLKIAYYKMYPQPVTNLAEIPVYLVEAISDYPGGGYSYVIGLTPDSGATHGAVGDSHCVVQFVGVIPSVIDNTTGAIKQPAFVGTIHFPKLADENTQKVSDLQKIKDILGSDDYEAAHDILMSARKK